MDEEDEKKGFSVRDRRRFTETGESREPEEKPSAGEEESSTRTGAASAKAEPPREDSRAGEAIVPDVSEHPPITFGTFIVSLSTQALLCLGEITDPRSGEKTEDIEAARELIDILSVLQEKTRGNLDAEEARLIEGILFDLRMRFVEKTRS